MSDVVAIARKLTKKQREVICEIPASGWPASMIKARAARLYTHGLIAFKRDTEIGYTGAYLTPLGARVRAVLLAEAASDE